MSKSSKTKKNKIPVIGDKEYAEYINYLKMRAEEKDGEQSNPSTEGVRSNADDRTNTMQT